MEKFDETWLLLSIESLPNWKRIAFMAYCCERMLPNYRRFSDETGFGEANALRTSLDEIWGWVETDKVPVNLSGLISSCDEQAPNTEDFSSIYTSAALDAASVIAVTLESLEDPAANKLIEVATLARDTVYMFVDWQQESESSDLDSKEIIESNLMQVEMRAQKTSIDMLRNLQGERPVVSRELRRQWSKLSKGSLET